MKTETYDLILNGNGYQFWSPSTYKCDFNNASFATVQEARAFAKANNVKYVER